MALDMLDSGPVNIDPMREYILDMLDQLAAMAAENGDLSSARALWSCWGQVNLGASAVPPSQSALDMVGETGAGAASSLPKK